jgi:hypothetical protein
MFSSRQLFVFFAINGLVLPLINFAFITFFKGGKIINLVLLLVRSSKVYNTVQ